MFDVLFRSYDTIIFFDTETTGFDTVGAGDQIIELAAIACSEGQESSSFDDFVSLFGDWMIQGVPQKIIDLTGIDDNLLFKEGVDEEVALGHFMELFGGKTLLVAYNAQFDLIFLAHALVRHREKHPDWLRAFNQADYLDPCTVHRDRARAAKSHKLESAIEYFNLTDRVTNSHRAVDDARALMEVTQCLEAEDADIEFYINRFGWVKEPPKHPLKKVSYFDMTPWHNLPMDKVYARTNR